MHAVINLFLHGNAVRDHAVTFLLHANLAIASPAAFCEISDLHSPILQPPPIFLYSLAAHALAYALGYTSNLLRALAFALAHFSGLVGLGFFFFSSSCSSSPNVLRYEFGSMLWREPMTDDPSPLSNRSYIILIRSMGDLLLSMTLLNHATFSGLSGFLLGVVISFLA
jgi:hypothetical protein